MRRMIDPKLLQVEIRGVNRGLYDLRAFTARHDYISHPPIRIAHGMVPCANVFFDPIFRDTLIMKPITAFLKPSLAQAATPAVVPERVICFRRFVHKTSTRF
jgi:hypothetical protein